LVDGLPELMPPLLSDPQWAEDNGKSPNPKQYTAMCRELFDANIKTRKAAATALGNEERYERLLYLNFKSHTIFAEESKRKLFETVRIANPDLVCLSEALVPIALAERSGKLWELEELEALGDEDKGIVQPYNGDKAALGATPPNEEPEAPSDEAAQPKVDADNEEDKIEPELKRNLAPKFEAKKLGDYGGEPKVQQVPWFREFLDLGFRWIVFVNPASCPYGNNWGNCIVMKFRPDEVRCGHMECRSYRPPWEYEESRCYVGVRHGDRITVSTHFDDTPAGNGRKGEQVIPRREQAKELGAICKAWLEEGSSGKAAEISDHGVQARSTTPEEMARSSGGAAEDQGTAEDQSGLPRQLTLVGDLNAINPETYDERERAILDRHNRGNPCPTDAIEELNMALGMSPLNRNKFECRFNKTVTHGYSTWYNRYLDMLTDATDFDHQPLLLYREAGGSTPRS